jgi:homoserine O-succinyltransferase
MPVHLSTNHFAHDQRQAASRLDNGACAESPERPSRRVTVGVINNMSDGALEATERQFIALLNSASDGISIDLSFYSLSGISRGELATRHVQSCYSDINSLWNKQLDGLIVTGREPLTSNLADEPYWESFTRVLDWARDHTHSTVWSCLAAHAAILHMDSINRIKSSDKHCGIFECEQLLDHPLTKGTPPSFALPHSRWNGISESALTSSGYDVLTRAPDAGVDTFVKQLRSLFVFFQGHPEYESNTLLFEYRRDVSRFLKGEAKKYPLLPQNYFDNDTTNALMAIREEAITQPHQELLARLSGALEKVSIKNTWRTTATCIYKNWLEYICVQKDVQLESSKLLVKKPDCDNLAPVLVPTGGASVLYS